MQLLNEAHAALDKARKLPATDPTFQTIVFEFQTKLKEAEELWNSEQRLRAEAKFRAGE